jgi:hypothetical protein
LFCTLNSTVGSRNPIGGLAAGNAIASIALFPNDIAGVNANGGTALSPSKFMLRNQSNTNIPIGNSQPDSCFAECGNGAYYSYFPGNFWMANGDSFQVKSHWGNASGTMYWSFTLVTES